MALLQQKQTSQIFLWHCCNQAQNPHQTISLLQQTPKSPIWLRPPDLIMTLLQPDQFLNLTVALLQPHQSTKSDSGIDTTKNKTPKSDSGMFCSQTCIPKLTTATSQQKQQFKHLSMSLSEQPTTIKQSEYGNVSANTTQIPKIWLLHCLSRNDNPTIWLWHCLSRENQSNIWLGHSLSKTKTTIQTLTMPVSQQTHNHNPKNLIMAVSQQKNKQTQSQHLTMAVSPQKNNHNPRIWLW